MEKNYQIHQLPLWEDNYIYALQEGEEVTLIDPGEFETVQSFLNKNNLKLKLIINTHHHFDHVGGNKKLKEYWACPIYAHKKDSHRIPGLELLPPNKTRGKKKTSLHTQTTKQGKGKHISHTQEIKQGKGKHISCTQEIKQGKGKHISCTQEIKQDRQLEEGEEFSVGSFHFKVLFTPGHTLGHILFWDKKNKLLFCGDTLFAMGCGRLFEGSPQQMFESLGQIKKLPPDTLVYSAHEYTLKNAEFALSMEPHNENLKKRYEKVKKLRDKQQASIPFLLEEDLLTNPFLRAKSLHEFTRIRQLRDQF